MRTLLLAVVLLFIACTCIQDAHAALHISEIYPAPESGKYEWVEITNTSAESVNIHEYVLRDIALHALVLPHIILEKNQFVIATSSGVLNNAGDTVELVLNGVVLDSLTYPSGITVNKSYTLCGDEWVITNLISPGFDSQSCLEEEPIVTFTPTLALLTPTRSPTLSPSKVTPTNIVKQNTMKVSVTDVPVTSVQSSVLGTQKAIQSFTQKHMPIHPTDLPTAEPSLMMVHVEPIDSPAPSERKITQKVYISLTLILLLSIALGGIIVYVVIKKHRQSTYNESYDT